MALPNTATASAAAAGPRIEITHIPTPVGPNPYLAQRWVSYEPGTTLEPHPYPPEVHAHTYVGMAPASLPLCEMTWSAYVVKVLKQLNETRRHNSNKLDNSISVDALLVM